MPLSRRSFLTSSVATAATLAATSRVLGANERIGVAVIGVNGMGHAHVKTLTARPDIDFVADGGVKVQRSAEQTCSARLG